MATRKRKTKKLTDLAPEPDARAELDSALFLKAAQPVLKQLDKDLLARAKGSPAVTDALKRRHQHDKEQKRTADSFAQWLDHFVGQVGAAWLLSCVFVRTLEDRGLLGQARIAGPGATDSQRLFFEMAPSLTERDYLLTVFRELAGYEAARDLFDAAHNPVWLLAPSAEAAKALLELFRRPEADAPAFRFGQADTRYLGDLYQDLDEGVRKRFALLQTPRFVESFILDRTLERAIERFGLDDTTLIDPTCGSGHFLLGAFDRLYDHRLRAEPGLSAREAAAKALDAVYGADINPYAVAIARFRLTLSFLEKGEYQKLADAPRLPLHLVVADSLLHNPHLEQTAFKDLEGQSARAWGGDEYALEDEAKAREVLHRRYAAVVGNPPYITVKDKVLRDRYRELYRSCYREYSLGVPFTERFFQLGREGAPIGMITANSFMKREFGKALIQEYLPTVNLDLIINTAGAFIPGHGTPTVLLFGSSEEPRAKDVHSVLANRGEPTSPKVAEEGLVWSSIARHWNEDGFENDFISVTRTKRGALAKHPWSLAGGGATALKTLLEERAGSRLADHTASIGFMCITKQDDVFSQPDGVFERHGVPPDWIGRFVIGEHVRDWAIASDAVVFFPYEQSGNLKLLRQNDPAYRFLWPHRTILGARAVFGGQTFREAGRPWFEFGQIPRDRIAGPAITFAFVATHNHFVLDRGGKVFNRTAPIIKLPETATEDDHLALLAYLNSSTAAFFLRQAGHSKGAQGVNEGHKSEVWEQFLEYSGSLVGSVPLPEGYQDLAPYGRALDRLAQERAESSPRTRLVAWLDTGGELAPSDWERSDQEILARMVALQEELDWAVYRLFRFEGTPDEPSQEPAALPPGLRPFEIVLAADSARDTAWFSRNVYATPSNAQPSDPRALSRVAAIQEHRLLRLLEQPEYKRRWTKRDYRAELTDAAQAVLLEVLEKLLANGPSVPHREPQLLSEVAAQLGDRLDPLLAVANVTLSQLLQDNAVPFGAVFRFSNTGLAKHEQWRATWDQQRREDAGLPANPAVPPKYKSTDFSRPSYWSLRGKLDVPKERFISYPGCESDEDGEPLYGWAGWDHLQRAQALAGLYMQRKQEGWAKDRLIPMLAGLLELIPWLEQWHNAPDPAFDGLRLGDYYRDTILAAECRALNVTQDDLRAWRPSRVGRASPRRS